MCITLFDAEILIWKFWFRCILAGWSWLAGSLISWSCVFFFLPFYSPFYFFDSSRHDSDYWALQEGEEPGSVSIEGFDHIHIHTRAHIQTHKLSLTPIYYDEEAIRATHILQKKEARNKEKWWRKRAGIYCKLFFGLFLTEGTKIYFFVVFFHYYF